MSKPHFEHTYLRLKPVAQESWHYSSIYHKLSNSATYKATERYPWGASRPYMVWCGKSRSILPNARPAEELMPGGFLLLLVGGLDFVPDSGGNSIIPTDFNIFFFRGVGIPPTRDFQWMVVEMRPCWSLGRHFHGRLVAPVLAVKLKTNSCFVYILMLQLYPLRKCKQTPNEKNPSTHSQSGCLEL